MVTNHRLICSECGWDIQGDPYEINGSLYCFDCIKAAGKNRVFEQTNGADSGGAQVDAQDNERTTDV